MRKIANFLLSALAFIGATPSAHASDTIGYVSYVHVLSGGQVLFDTSAARQRPACATVPNRWAFNGTTAAGQARLSVLMTAYALHKAIYVLGNGTCDVWGDTESVDYLNTDDPGAI